jgi:hypothetical protein
MKTEAWVFMLLVWSGVVALNIFCYRRILKRRSGTPGGNR